MKRLSPAALLFVLGAAACGDGGGGPTQQTQQVARVYVTPAEQTINGGETVQLAAQARDEENLVVGNTAFTWATLDPAVAAVSPAGLVTGQGAGTARIVAAAPNGVADTAFITVLVIASQCEESAVVNLAVGDTMTVRGSAATLLCLGGASAGAEYTIIPVHATSVRDATLAVRFTPVGVRAVTGPPTPSLAPAGTPGLGAAASIQGDGGFHTRLNARAREPLSRLVDGARAAYRARATGPRLSLQQTTPAIGTALSLNVSQSFCTPQDRRGGRVVAVSNRAIIVADTMNPAGGFTQADYDHVAVTFDTLVYPVNTAAFGEPLDVDQNGRVIIFYTRAVNELTPANVNYVVGGFFYGRDLFPLVPGGAFSEGCAGSNYAEMFYMLAPDPAGAVNGNARSTAYVRNSTLSVVGHEFQHLISASRRLYAVPGVDGTDWSEDTYLNEGLSHIAEELLFFHRAQLAPRMNLNASVLTNQPSRNAFLEFQQSNFGRYEQWLLNPDQDSPYDRAGGEEDDLATRGASWAFLRYVADQRAGNDNQLWYDLVNNEKVGLANLQEVLGQDPVPLYRSWAVAGYTDDALAGIPAVFTHPSWNFRSVFGTLENSYPLEVTPLTSGQPLNLSLVSGGAAYLRAGVSAGQRASIQVTSGNAAPPQTLFVTVVRTR